MKRFYVFVLILMLGSLTCFSQLININPDPNGDPWYVGAVTPLSPEQRIDLPTLVLSEASLSTPLPFVVDNSKRKYMRSVFSQVGGCCTRASEVGYMFTYEINHLRDVSAADSMNLYPTHFTWNLQYGAIGASFPTNALNIIKEIGTPNVLTWGGMSGDPTQWMSGYDKYYAAMHNKVSKIMRIEKATTEEGLFKIKHWINDHAKGEDSGGLLCFFTNLRCYPAFNDPQEPLPFDVLPAESPDTGYGVVADLLCPSGGTLLHEMAIVGYNDSICYDVNGDGNFTTDIDLNGDGKIDLLDSEYGALKIVNSWGEGFPNSQSGGYFYLMYRTIPMKTVCTVENSIFEYSTFEHNEVYVIEAEDNVPKLTAKVSMQYPCRSKIEMLLGHTDSFSNEVSPNLDYIDAFNNTLACLPMQGINNNPIELGIEYDLSHNIKDYSPKRFCYVIEEDDLAGQYDGTIHRFSLMDYRWGESFEIQSSSISVPIENNSRTYVWVDYDLMKHERPYVQDTIIRSNMVARFNPRFSNNATLELVDQSRIDMYNSTITIDAGSELRMNRGATIIAKRGDNTIKIDGKLLLGNNVTFKAERGAKLKILLTNHKENLNLNNARFINCVVETYADTTYVEHCAFESATIVKKYKGLIRVDSCNFDFSQVVCLRSMPYVENDQLVKEAGATVIIQNSQFDGKNRKAGDAITLIGCLGFSIKDNTIKGYKGCGVAAMYCIRKEANKRNFITGNTIIENINNSNTADFSAGILLYNSQACVKNNAEISRNGYGIVSLNRSVASIIGEDCFSDISLMQNIRNNRNNQLYASFESFPSPCRYNAFGSSGFLGVQTPWIFCSEPRGEGLNIMHNKWSQQFTPSQHLYPFYVYDYIPVCNDENQRGSQLIDFDLFFEEVESLLENGEEDAAKILLRGIVEQYPNSWAATSALNRLYAIACTSGFNDSNFLDYLSTNIVIQNTPQLYENARYLKALYSKDIDDVDEAQAQLEAILSTACSHTDSISAMIDLVYLGQFSASIRGEEIEELTNYDDFMEYRDEQLSNLFVDLYSIERSAEAIYDHELFQNIPNPAKELVRIDYRLDVQGTVFLKFYDHTGMLVLTCDEGFQSAGHHSVILSLDSFRAPYYIYSLIVNGKEVGSRKMLMK